MATPRLGLSHRQHVCHLYARSLKLARDWCTSRRAWFPVAYVIRHQFRENIHESDARKIDFLIRGTEDILAYLIHPDPYHSPGEPGGSKYQRNIPVPIDVCLNGWREHGVLDEKEQMETAQGW